MTWLPLLVLLGISISFNPTTKFLGVIFDRNPFLGGSSPIPYTPNSIRDLKPCSPLQQPPEVSLRIYSPIYKAFMKPVLTIYASHGWFRFPCITLTNQPEILHRAACRALLDTSTPIPLLLLEGQPPLKSTLERQTLSCF